MQRTPRARLLASTAVGLIAALAAGPAARANPTGGTVVGGSATISDAPGQTTINQSSQRAVINWQDFSVGHGETTTFVQPNASAVTLNRVTGTNPSVVNGTINANGNVFLINQNGVMIGAGATVNVGSLVATTSDINTDAFMGGSNHFDQATANPGASIVNEGTITVADHGLAGLVGPTVANRGVIAAKLGTVALGSAETFTVDLAGDGLISFDTGQPVARQGGTAQVTNAGTIDAAGGTVILSAGQAASVVDNAIDMTGVIRAQSIGTENGIIVLGGGAGTTVVTGTIDASGAAPGTKGGTVEITGSTVALASTAKVDVSGSAGGGTVRVGGDRQGTGTTRRAERTLVAKGAVIDASARDNGNGGTVIVWSESHTRYDGLTIARGGASGGNGGFVETSSRGYLAIASGRVDAGAGNGDAGAWLLDPANITITDDPVLLADPEGVFSGGDPNVWLLDAGANDSFVDVAAVEDSLNASTDVTISTSNPSGNPGIISLGADIDVAVGSTGGDGVATLSLFADDSIAMNNGFGITNRDGLLIVNLQMNEAPVGALPTKTRDINIGDITADGGDIFLVADATYSAGAGGRVFYSGDFTSINGGNASTYALGNTIEVDGTIDIDALSLAAIDLAALDINVPDLEAGAFFDAIAAIASTADEFGPTFVTGNIASITVRDGTAPGVLTIDTNNLSFGADAGGTIPATMAAPKVVLSAVPGQDVNLNANSAVNGLFIDTAELVAFDFGVVDTLQLGRLSDTPNVLIGGNLPAALLGNANLNLDVFAANTILVGEPAGTLAAIPTSLSVGRLRLFTGDAGSTVTIGSAASTTIIANEVEISQAPALSTQGVPGTVIIGAAGAATIIADTLRIGRTTEAAGVISFDIAAADTQIGVQGNATLTVGDTIIFSDSLSIGGATETTIETFTRFLAQGREGSGSATIDSTDGSFNGDTLFAGVDGNSLLSFEYDEIRVGNAADIGTITANATNIDLLSRNDGITVEVNGDFNAEDRIRFALGDVGELNFGGTLNAANATFMAYFLGQDTVVGEDPTSGVLNAMYDQADFTAMAGVDALLVTSQSVQTAGVPLPGGDSNIVFSLDTGAPALTLPVDTTFSTVAGSGTGNILAGSSALPVGIDGSADITFVTKAGGITTFAGTVTAAGDILVDSVVEIDGPTSITANGSNRFTGTVDASATAVGASLIAGATTGTLTFEDAIGGTTALVSTDLDAGTTLSVNQVATTGDQDYNAGDVRFAAGNYTSVAGDIIRSGVGTTTIVGAVNVDAGQSIDFGDTVTGATGAGDNLTANARGGRVALFGAVSNIDVLDLTSSTEIVTVGLTTLGNATLTAPAITLTGGTYSFGGTGDFNGNVAALVGASISANSDLTVDGDVDLATLADATADIALASTTGSVTVTGNVGGNRAPQDLTVTAAANVDVGGAITAGNQTFTGQQVALHGALYDAGGDMTVNGPTALDVATTVTADGAVRFDGTIDAATAGASLSATAGTGQDVTVTGLIGSTGRLAALTLLAGDRVSTIGASTTGNQTFGALGGVDLTGTYDSEAGAIAFNAPVALNGQVVVVANTNASFSGAIDGPADAGLDVTAETGGVTFGGAIGATQPLNGLSVAAATTIDIGNAASSAGLLLTAPTINLTGGTYAAGTDLVLTGAVTLLIDTVLTAVDALTVTGTIDSVFVSGIAPSLNATSAAGAVSLGGAIGATSILQNLTVQSATGATVASATTAGNQSYLGATTLQGSAYDAGGDFTVDGAALLATTTTVDADGAVLFGGTVNAASAGASLAATAGAGQDATITGIVGGTARLATLSLSAGDRVSAVGANTTGSQDYAGAGIDLAGSYDSNTGSIGFTGPVALNGPVTVVANTDATFTGAIEGTAGSTLDVTAETGGVTFGGAIGAAQPLAGLTVNAQTTIDLASVTTAGDLRLTAPAISFTGGTYSAVDFIVTGALALTVDAVLTAANLMTVDGTIDSAASPVSLEINSSTAAVLVTGAIGAITALQDLTVNGSAGATVANATTDGDQRYLGNTTLQGTAYDAGGGFIASGTIALTGATTVTASDQITFVGAINRAASAPSASLTATVEGDGDIAVQNGIGKIGQLAALSLTAANGEVSVDGGVTTSGDQTYTATRIDLNVGEYESTAGNVTIDGNLLTTGAVDLVAGNNITVDGTIDSAQGDADGLRGRLTIEAQNGVTITGEVGQNEALASFSLTADSFIDPPSVTTFGPQFYSAPTILLTGDQYLTNGGSFTTVGALTLSNPTVLIDTTGGSIAVTGGDITFDGSAVGDAVTLNAGPGDILGLDVSFLSLIVESIDGSARMDGFIGTVTGQGAAILVGRPDGIADAYLFNGCTMGISCFTTEIPTEVTEFQLPDPPALLVLAPPPLIVAASESYLDDPRFVFSNTGKDALWRLDTIEPARDEENAQ